MTAQKGKDLLLKVDSDGVGSFVTVAGLRARTLAFNAASVDVTDQESAGRWRELLEGAGIKTARVSGSGIFKDASSDETLPLASLPLRAERLDDAIGDGPAAARRPSSKSFSASRAAPARTTAAS